MPFRYLREFDTSFGCGFSLSLRGFLSPVARRPEIVPCVQKAISSQESKRLSLQSSIYASENSDKLAFVAILRFNSFRARAS
jgi:hypothetical protein